MKKRRKSQQRSSTSVAVSLRSSRKAFLVLFVPAFAILIAAIALRCFKAVHTGIIYDEVYSVMNFGQHFHDAIALYKNPNNNHVLNSILINVCRVLFSGHEFFYRYHTIFFGGLYCIAVTCLAWVLITNRLLKIAFIALLTLQWFVFDLSFLARGYSIALAAIFGGLAILVYVLKRRVMFSYIWLPVTVLTLMNFLAFGSMLSVLLLLVVINACYIFLFSYRVFPETTKPLKSIAIHFIAVPICSGLSLFLLYQYIYRDILAIRNDFGNTTLMRHLKEVLWVNMLAGDQLWAQIVYAVFLLLTAMAILSISFVLLKTRKFSCIPFLDLKQPHSFIVLTTVLFFIAIYIYRNLFQMPLGFARNGVFLIPLFLLSCGIILDSVCKLLSSDRLRITVAGFICVLTLVLTVASRPSLYAVNVYNWELQSMAWPLIRDLQTIDPHRRWKIALTEKTKNMNLPLQYYQLNGYPVRQAGGNDFDVVVTYQSESIPGTFFYREDFYDSFECRIVFKPALIERYSLNKKIRR